MKISILIYIILNSTVFGISDGNSDDNQQLQHVNDQLSLVKDLIQDENYADATHLLSNLCNFARNNGLEQVFNSLRAKMKTLGEIKTHINALGHEIEATENVSVLSNLKLLAQQKDLPEALPLLESKLLKAFQDKLTQVEELTKQARHTDSIFLLSDLYYISTSQSNSNLPELLNSILVRLSSVQWDLIKNELNADMLNEVDKLFLRTLASNIDMESNSSPRTASNTRQDVALLFGVHIHNSLHRLHTDPGSFIKAFVNGTGFCSLFKHPNDPTSDLDLSNKNEVKFSKMAYLIGSLQGIYQTDLWKSDLDQTEMTEMFRICSTFNKDPLGANERKLFIFELLDKSNFKYRNNFYWFDIYRPDYSIGICKRIDELLVDGEIFNHQDTFISRETKSYFIDECVDDIGEIMRGNFENTIQFVDRNFVWLWLRRLREFIEAHKPEFEHYLAFYNSIILDYVENSQITSKIRDSLNPQTNPRFDLYLDETMQVTLHPRLNMASSIFNGKKLCRVFLPNFDSHQDAMKSLSYFWRHGHRMSGKLFNKTVSPISYILLQNTCASIEAKYAQKEYDIFMTRFNALILDEEYDDALMLIDRMLDETKGQMLDEIEGQMLEPLRLLFLSTNWKVSLEFLTTLFKKTRIVEHLLRLLNFQATYEMLSHLHDLAEKQDNNNGEVMRLLESKLQQLSDIDEVDKLRGEEAIMKISDLYFDLNQERLDQFLPPLYSKFLKIKRKPVAKLLSLKLLDKKNQLILNSLYTLYPANNDVKGQMHPQRAAGLFLRGIIKLHLDGKDPASLMETFKSGSGFCSIFKHPNDPTNDLGTSNKNEQKFARAAFLFGQLSGKGVYDIKPSTEELKLVRRIILFCLSYQKHSLEPIHRKIFLANMLDRASDLESLMIGPISLNSKPYTGSEGVCSKLYSLIEGKTFEANFPSAEVRGFFLEECADDLAAGWENSLTLPEHWQIYKWSLIERWLMRIRSFLEPEISIFVFQDHLALIDSLILPEASSRISDLLNPRRNRQFDEYLQAVVSEVNDISAVDAYYNGTGICEIFNYIALEKVKILGVLTMYWSQGHRMRGSLFDEKCSSISNFVYLRTVCNHLRARADSETPSSKKVRRV